ncbi:MAG: ferritin-like domain-containing protein [Actinomycetota bacterium]|nr:ferritin-like domain-containing protein [Actinomycetota bacterium]
MAGELREKLVEYVQDAHAMEKNSLTMMNSMLRTTTDPEMRELLEHHVQETEQHQARLRERLDALGEGTSTVRDTGALLGSVFKGLLDQLRAEKPSKNARDGYVTEHLEIAAYELLERLAARAGDEATAEVARLNLQDEKAMADKLANTWDKVIDLTLQEEGIETSTSRPEI